MSTPLSTLFREGAVVVELATALVDEQLFPEELAHVANAVPSRRAEFGTGRVAARRALAQMGIQPVPILSDAHRVPVWPEGIVGSITHSAAYCAVVVHRNPPVRSVGIDAEILQPLPPEMWSLVLLPSERAWIHSFSDAAQDDLGLLFFSAKEAYYKCQFPFSRVTLEFAEVEVDVDTAANQFEARALREGLPECVRYLRGNYAFHRGMVFCGIELVV
jgi:4'-phosphopantetheinyl transferase EntD